MSPFRRNAAALSLALCLPLCLALPARAADDDLFRAWGGKDGIRAVMDDFVPRLERDPRIGHFFRLEPKTREHLARQLTEQLCQLAGGPCRYSGPDMKVAHQDLEIGRAHFNALVEVLQVSMAEHGVPWAAQRAMLARLAPMHREVINTPAVQP
jgi:hemoglobin